MSTENSQKSARTAVRKSGTRRLAGRIPVFGILVLAVLVISSMFAPVLAPYDPSTQSVSERLMPPAWMEGGSTAHLLGTDGLGRDVLSRLIHGSQVSLMVGVIVVILAGAFGTLVGLIAAYKGGWVNTLLMRLVDLVMAFPGLLIALVILAAVGPSIGTIVFVLAFNNWMIYARITHGIVLGVREQEYIEAAETTGASNARIILRHVLPSLSAPLLTLATLEFAAIVLSEAALSYLGVGVQPPMTSWGLDVSIGQDYIYNAWWLVTFPGLAIAVTVMAVNMVANWLRIQLNPVEADKMHALTVIKQRRA